MGEAPSVKGRLALFFSVLSFALAGQCAAAKAESKITVTDLRTFCQSHEPTPNYPRIVCIMYLRGVLDGFTIQSVVSKSNLFFCNTAKSNFKFSDLPELYVKYTDQHPESERTDHAGVAFAKMLKERSPCP